MRRNRWWAFVRMVLGSIIGVIGFGTLSYGFIYLSLGRSALGVVEILFGAWIAMGVMAPLRKHRTSAQ